MEPMLFGQILLNFHLVSEQDLRRCLGIQKHLPMPKPLGEILVDEGLIDEQVLRTILSVQQRELNERANNFGMSSHELAHRLERAEARDYLKLARDLGASDLYLTAGKVPLIRLHGRLNELPIPALDKETTRTMVRSLLTPEQQNEYHHLRRLDASIVLDGVGRFRINVFRHHDGVGAVIRILPDHVTPLDELGLPNVVRDFIDYKTGLVLITGTTGSGKSTTLSAIIDEMNQRHKRHIVTLEDPIETLFESDQCFITQREVGTHTNTFATGLRAALREDPDVIVVGELRDPETFQTALTAAETGHLVFGTMHTKSAPGTIMRVVDQFPANQRAHVRTMLAGSLRAVLTQELVPTVDGESRVLATETMVVNAAVSNLIREDRSWQIPMVMQTQSSRGMSLMDDSLDQLLRQERISVEEAVARAKDTSRFLQPA